MPTDAVDMLSEGLLPERAALAANLQKAVNGFRDAVPTVGDCICAVGAGTFGCLAASRYERRDAALADKECEFLVGHEDPSALSS